MKDIWQNSRKIKLSKDVIREIKMQNLNNSVPVNGQHKMDKIYYQINPSNKNEFRTVYLKWNIQTLSHMQPSWSNYVNGSPPDGMKPISQFHLSQLMRMQPNPSVF